METTKSSSPSVRFFLSSLGPCRKHLADLLAHEIWQDWHETFCFWHWLFQEKDLQNVTSDLGITWHQPRAFHQHLSIPEAMLFVSNPRRVPKSAIFRSTGHEDAKVRISLVCTGDSSETNGRLLNNNEATRRQSFMRGKMDPPFLTCGQSTLANCEALFQGSMDTPTKTLCLSNSEISSAPSSCALVLSVVRKLTLPDASLLILIRWQDIF